MMTQKAALKCGELSDTSFTAAISSTCMSAMSRMEMRLSSNHGCPEEDAVASAVELTEPTRGTVTARLDKLQRRSDQFHFPSKVTRLSHVLTRQYARNRPSHCFPACYLRCYYDTDDPCTLAAFRAHAGSACRCWLEPLNISCF